MNRIHFPGVGQRMVKSAVAVGICMLLYALSGADTVPFQASIAALLCIQPYRANSWAAAGQRVAGTLLGAACGMVVYLLWMNVLAPMGAGSAVYALVVSLGIVATLYAAVLFRQRAAAVFSCVIYLCIAMKYTYTGTESPAVYVVNQLAATLLGIAVGMAVNAVHLPQRRERDVLFLANLDRMLPHTTGRLSDYSRVGLNHLLGDGIPLSLITMLTPGSMLEALGDVQLKLPVILMNGAALYDPVRHVFLAKRELPHDDTISLRDTLQGLGTESFQVVMADNAVLMFHGEMTAGEQALYDATCGSPYRNYIRHSLPPDVDVAYLLVLDETEKVAAIRLALEEQGLDGRFRLFSYESIDFPGCAYLKIYHRDASPENMLEPLRAATGFSEITLVGADSRGDRVVHELKRASEASLLSCLHGRK